MPSNSSSHSVEPQSGPSGARRKFKEMEKPFMVRWKFGKRSVDPRLVEMLEIFRELYEKREEFFKKIFPRSHNEFADVFKKIGAAASAKNDHGKIQTMQRSLSLGSQPSPSQVGESDELRLNRFKVRTPAVVVVWTGSQGGGASSSQEGRMTSGSK